MPRYPDQFLEIDTITAGQLCQVAAVPGELGPGHGTGHSQGGNIAAAGNGNKDGAGESIGDTCFDHSVKLPVAAPKIAADHPGGGKMGGTEGKKRRSVNGRRHALVVKGIDEDEIVAFVPVFLEKAAAVPAVDDKSWVFREVEVGSGRIDDGLGVVNRIDAAGGEMVVKKSDKGSRANPDYENISRLRLEKQCEDHIPGVRQNQFMGAGQRHAALEMLGGEIKRTVVAMVLDFHQVTVPVICMDHSAWAIRHRR